MKTSFFPLWLLIATLAIACGQHTEQPTAQAGLDHAHQQDHSPKLDIQIGYPEKRALRQEIRCRAQIHVPPQSIASLHAPLGGFVQHVEPLYPGDRVEKGQLLATLTGEAYIALQEQFLALEQEVAYQEQEYQRTEGLTQTNAAAKRELLTIGNRLRQAQQKLQAIEARLQIARLSPQTVRSQGIQAQVRMTAPVSGYLTNVLAHPGKHLQPGELLYQVVDPEHFHLEIAVFPTQSAQIRKGQRVHFALPGDPTTYAAEVYLSSHQVGPDGTIPVHAHFEEEGLTGLPVGAVGEATILTGADSAWMLPQTAVVREGATAYVFIPEGDHYAKTAIQTAGESGDWVIINSIEGHPIRSQVALTNAYYLNHDPEAEVGHSH